jgi:hypothetical protein
MNCPDCREPLSLNATFCGCGWREGPGREGEKKVVFRPCHFSGEGKCRYDKDRANRYSKPVGATVLINDYWICNWHYENGYNRVLRQGEPLPRHEQKIQARLFGGKQDDEAKAEREAIQQEAT